jgi:hypothetical protein
MRERASERVRAWLTHPRLPTALACVAVVLSIPTLFCGLEVDDWWHRVLLTRTDVGAPGPPPPWNMFRAFDGRPEWTRWAIDHGIGAWWAEPNVRAAFFRPLTAATHMLDYALWPNAPWMMHAQSIAWFVACIALGVALLRRVLGDTWVAGLASVLFTIDPTHGLAVGWIAQRNTLVCTAFGLASVLAHDRARREASFARSLASAALLALALAGGEGGVGAVGYLFAYAVALDDAPIAARVRSLVPHAMVLVVWATLYRAMHYGAHGSAMYVDPASSPLRYLGAVIVRGPIELATELGGPPPDVLPFLPARFELFALAAAIVSLALGAFTLAPMRRRREVRFFALGAVAALLPVCATTPTSRILYFASVGGMALVALMAESVVEGRARSLFARAWTTWAVGGHLLIGAPMFVVFSVSLSFVQRAGDRLAADVPRDASIERLVIVNPPDCSFVGMFAIVGKMKGEPMPARSICLAPGSRPVELRRLDDRSIFVRAPGGFVQNEMDGLVRDPRDPLPTGTRIALTKLVIEIASDVDGRADAAIFRFDAPLEDRSLRWMAWDGADFVDFVPPAVGAGATLAPPAIFR